MLHSDPFALETVFLKTFFFKNICRNQIQADISGLEQCLKFFLMNSLMPLLAKDEVGSSRLAKRGVVVNCAHLAEGEISLIARTASS